jgi:hypothetical protein
MTVEDGSSSRCPAVDPDVEAGDHPVVFAQTRSSIFEQNAGSLQARNHRSILNRFR